MAILCLFALLCAASPGTLLLLGLPLLVAILWLPAQIVLATLRPPRRRRLAADIGLLAATAAIVWMAETVHAHSAREAAERVRRAVTLYHSAHGTWPARLADVGLAGDPALRRWHIVYVPTDGTILYPSTIIPFDAWGRGPDDADWVFHPD